VSWIKIKRYEDDPTLSWEERYARLEAHHRIETEFLIATVEKLAGMHGVEAAIERAENDERLLEMANRHGELVWRRHGHGDPLTPDEEAELNALDAEMDRIG
jgi:hypothetical protein